MQNNEKGDNIANALVPETLVEAEEASIFGAYIEPFVAACISRLSPLGGAVFREASRRVVDAAFATNPSACFAVWGETPDPIMPAVLAFWSIYTNALTMARMEPVKVALEARLATMPRMAIPRNIVTQRLAPIEHAWFEGELPPAIAAETRRAFTALVDAFAAEDPPAVLRGYGQGKAQEAIFRALTDIVEKYRTDDLDVIVLAMRGRIAELDLARTGD